MVEDDRDANESMLPLNKAHPPLVKEFAPGTAKDETFDVRGADANAYRGMEFNRKVQLQSWLLFFLMGVGTGAIAFGMDKLEEFLVGTRASLA